MTSVSVTGSPSKRSTASRFAPPRLTNPTSAASAGRSHSLSGSAGARATARRARRTARLAAEQDDVRSRDAGGAGPGALGHGERSAVRAGRVGGRRGRAALARRPPWPQLRSRSTAPPQRELRAAEPLDEVAAPARAERLERPQLAVDRAVAAGDPLAADGVAGDDAVPLEQAAPRARGDRARRRRTAAPRATSVPASRSGERAARARSGARGGRLAAAGSALGTERRPGVVGHLAGPDESHRAGSAASASSPVAPRSPPRTARRRRAPRVSRRAPRLPGPARLRDAEQRRVVAEEHRHSVEPGSDPHELARRTELVELLGPVARARDAAAPRPPTARRAARAPATE